MPSSNRKTKKKKESNIVEPPEEEEPSLFASIGRMVNSGTQPRASGDSDTIGTSKYSRESSETDEATRRANEMANAMAWLTNPAAASASEDEEPEMDVGADLFGESGNWWESELKKVTRTNNNVYVRSDEYAWVPARLVSLDSTTAKVAIPQYEAEEFIMSDNGKAAVGFKSAVVELKDYPNYTLPLQNTGKDGHTLMEFEDMSDLPFLHEAAVLYNLKSRHVQGLPFCRYHDIVIAVNPYQWLTHLYQDEVQKQYAKMIAWKRPEEGDHRANLRPHVYEVSALCYRDLAMKKENQSILVSGESGSGKTEIVKICVNHICVMQRDPNKNDEEESLVVRQIRESNTLLEAFGNAKTRHNDNASRFGRYTMLQFNHHPRQDGELPRAELAGSTSDIFLLEKSRVVYNEDAGRSFHAFYQLLAASDDEKEKIWKGLVGKSPESFRYLGARSEVKVDGLSDVEWFRKVKNALLLFGVVDEAYVTLFRAISACLQLGNLDFAPERGDDERTVITSKKEFTSFCELVGCDEKVMERALTERTIKTRGEEYKVPLNHEIAKVTTDAFAKEIYAKAFLWLVRSINEATCAEKKEDGLIGVLDISGPAGGPPKTSGTGFEDLCINYCNEKLQYKFIKDVFVSVIQEYKAEGLILADIKYDDNSDVINLLEGKLGFIKNLDEECVRPKGNDAAFVSKSVKANRKVACMIQKRTFGRLEFGIHHYFGPVVYSAQDFVNRNSDSLAGDIKAAAESCANAILSKYLSSDFSSTNKSSGAEKQRRRKDSLLSETVMTQLKNQLKDLISELGRTKSRYIRCIKPNTQKRKLLMQHITTLEQLRCSGAVEAITLSRSIYPSKLTYDEMKNRYHMLNEKKKKGEYSDTKEEAEHICEQCLKQFESTTKDGVVERGYVMGKSKCYFKSACLESLEAQRTQWTEKKAVTIQKFARRFLVKRMTSSETPAVLKNKKKVVKFWSLGSSDDDQDGHVMGNEILLNPEDLDDILKWWSTSQEGKKDMAGNDFETLESIKEIVQWWSANPNYKPPYHKTFDEKVKHAMKLRKVFAKYKFHSKDMTADEKCNELIKSLKWLQNKNARYIAEAADYDDQGLFDSVNTMFSKWKEKGGNTPQSEGYLDDDPQKIDKRAWDLVKSLRLFSNGAYEQDPQNCTFAVNRLKDLFADWKLMEDDGVQELEDALSWWKFNANKYDPLNASTEETDMFLMSKKILSMLGLKEGDGWEKGNKEFQQLLSLWTKYKAESVADLDDLSAGKLKKLEDALLRIKRDRLNMNELKPVAREMEDLMLWYISKGSKIDDLSMANNSDATKVRKAKRLLSRLGVKAHPTPTALKEIAESLIYLRQNMYNPKIFDKFDGEEGAKFQRLRNAMIDWRLKTAESDVISADERVAFVQGIEIALDWWIANGENFDFETADLEQVSKAQLVKRVLNVWIPPNNEDVFTFDKSAAVIDEIKGAMKIYRDDGKSLGQQSLSKLKEIMLQWRRDTATSLSEVGSGRTVWEMINGMNWWKKKGMHHDVAVVRPESGPVALLHGELSIILEAFQKDLESPPHLPFRCLAVTEQQEVIKDLIDLVAWWERSGKKIDTAQAEEDFEMFDKARLLGKLWNEAKVEYRKREASLVYVSAKAKKSNSIVVRPQQESLVLWNNSYEEVATSKAADRPEAFNFRKDMKKAIGWWSSNQHYKCPYHKKVGGDIKRAIKSGKALENYSCRALLPSKRRTKAIDGALKRLPSHTAFFIREAREFDWNQATLEKVNILFYHYTLAAGLEREKYDPRKDQEDTTRRIKDLRGSLGLVLSGAFDHRHPQYNCAVINRLKVLFAEWKLKHVDGVTELEDALKWWEIHAPTYNPFTSTDEQDAMFMKSKKLVSMFGLRESDSWNEKTREVEEGLELWLRYKDTSPTNLDVTTRRSITKVRSVLLQLNRDGLGMADMKSLSTEMNKILSWYLERGFSIEDLSCVDEQDSLKFQRTQEMLGTWGTQSEPSPKQLKEIEDYLVSFQEKKCDPAIIDKCNDEEDTGFRVLEDAMLDWRLRQAESDTIAPKEGERQSQTLENALDWWIANGDNFDVDAADMKQVFMAQIIKSLLDSWIGRKSDEEFSFKQSTHAAFQIKEVLLLYRRTGFSFDVSSLDAKPSVQRRLLKLKGTMLQWRRDTATNTFGGDAEQTIKDMMNGLDWWKKKGNEYDPVDDRLKNIPSFLHHKQVSRSVYEFEKHSIFSDIVFLPGLSKKEEKKLRKALDASESALDCLRTTDDIEDDGSAGNDSSSGGADVVDEFMSIGSELEELEEFNVAAGVGMDFRPEDSPDLITMIQHRQQFSLRPGKTTKKKKRK